MQHYFMPTEIFAGRDCVTERGEKLKELGAHALIVSGKSAHKNGALCDVLRVLEKNGQNATVFDRVAPNPTLPCVREGLALLKSAGADFVIAIGGGSAMDAAKAIAILAVQERNDEEVFSGGYENNALAMAHIPTTAGTGSEVTPYSVLTNDFLETKTSISSPCLFPKFAFLDGKYMATLPWKSTVNTALDAFSHAVESILSRNENAFSRLYAKEACEGLFAILKTFTKEREISLEERDRLLYLSTLAGMAIAQSGTTAVHGMGYPLTYHFGIDHGRANALLLGETLKLCKEKRLPEADEIFSICRVEGEGEFCAVLNAVLGEREHIARETLEQYALLSSKNKNIVKSKYQPDLQEIQRMYFRSLT